MQAQAISIIRKLIMMGGGDRSYIGMSLEDILLPEENENAIYQLNNITQESFTILLLPQLSRVMRSSGIVMYLNREMSLGKC